jgi:tetratricopeptide (TPR) repeat protein
MINADDLIKRGSTDIISKEKVESEKLRIQKLIDSYHSEELKLETLENLAKKRLPADIQRFIFTNIAMIHEHKSWWTNAARYYRNAADIAVTFKEREDLYMKEVEMYIKAMMYNYADEAMKKAMEAVANQKNREEIKKKVINLYLNEARIGEMTEKRNHAIKAYERAMFFIPDDDPQKRAINEKLVILLERVGKVRDSMQLRDRLKKI